MPDTAENRRVNSNSERIRVTVRRTTYEDGNAVRKVYEIPGEEELKALQREPEVSSQVRRNRAAAKNIGVGYILFLTAACLATLFLCVNYLQMRSSFITQSENLAVLESEYTSLKADNDAYYSQVLSSVTLDDVRDAALNRLGLHYPTESQIRYYSLEDTDYVRQYQDVPGSR